VVPDPLSLTATLLANGAEEGSRWRAPFEDLEQGIVSAKSEVTMLERTGRGAGGRGEGWDEQRIVEGVMDAVRPFLADRWVLCR
jgi:hypothetical protein